MTTEESVSHEVAEKILVALGKHQLRTIDIPEFPDVRDRSELVIHEVLIEHFKLLDVDKADRSASLITSDLSAFEDRSGLDNSQSADADSEVELKSCLASSIHRYLFR